MESVIVTSSPRISSDSSCCNKTSYFKPQKEVIYQSPYRPIHPVKEHMGPPDCCEPVEIDVPLKKTCVYLSQTPVILFIILLTLIYLIAAMQCWNACSCNQQPCKKCTDSDYCDNDCVSSTQRWTAFAVNTIIYILFAILISMWIYRLFQYHHSRGLSIAIAITVPVFTWFFYKMINKLAMGTDGDSH